MDATRLAVAPTPAIAEDLGGGRSPTPAGKASLRERVKAAFEGSAWAPVLSRSSAIFAGMLGLAAIGAWSTLAGAGVPFAIPSRPSADASGTWIAAAPEASASSRAQAAETPPVAPSEPAGAGVTADGKVVLNLATADDLVKLPRVGPKRAQAILDLRKRLGKFRKPTDLLRVRGIGPKTLRLMLPKLLVDAEAAPPK